MSQDFEVVKNAVENADKYITFINALWGVGGFLITKLIWEAVKWSKIRKLKKVLSVPRRKFSVSNGKFSVFNGKCSISLPYYERNLYGYKVNVVIQQEAILQQKIVELLNIIKIQPLPFNNTSTAGYSEIHVGGPIANIRTSTYMHNFFPDLKWNVLPEHRNKYNETDMKKIYEQVIRVNENKEGFSFGNEDKDFFEYKKDNKDCAILIKLTPNDLGMNKTVHLLFGGGNDGTSQAVNFFAENHSLLFKKFKNKHYFIIIPVNKKDKTIDLAQGIKDLTLKAFK